MSKETPQPSILKQAGTLRKQNRLEDALHLLRESLRRNKLHTEEIARAGQLISGIMSRQTSTKTLSVRILGQCTTTWLMQSLVAMGLKQSIALTASEGEYDNVFQEMIALKQMQDLPEVLVLLPWHQRLLHDTGKPINERVEDDLAFWQQAWMQIDGLGIRLVQVGYDWLHSGPMGYHLGAQAGDIAAISQINQALREHLPTGAYFVDLPVISGQCGRERFYDPRRYAWTKQPFSEEGAVRLAQHVTAGIRALITGPKKVLALDLDYTLWGGVVGETGPMNIELGESPEGEAYRTFQKYLKALTRRGILLAVSSKNNPRDAREPFITNKNMILSLEDFAAFEANWESKGRSLERIAQQLNLGLNSFVFFDDNPAEREQIRQALPDVEVVEVPTDPAEYIRALDSELWFESVALTHEDTARSAQYQAEKQRKELSQKAGTLEAYLASLDMQAVIRPIDSADMQRVVQLIGKTNQFNLTTRRHSQPQLEKLLAQPGAVGFTMRLRDKFGDHGLVSVLIALPVNQHEAPTYEVDTWLMSCRVISRTAEYAFFNVLIEQLRQRGIRQVIGRYIPTNKNQLVQNLYPELGFESVADEGDRGRSYRLMLKDWHAGSTVINVQFHDNIGKPAGACG